MNAPTSANVQADLPKAGQVVLLTGAAGFFLANFAVQFLTHIGGASASSLASAGNAWATATYTLASLAGAVFAQPLEQRLGKRSHFVIGALLLASFGWSQAMAPCQLTLLTMRGFEGFVSGGFGPRALLAAFVLCRQGRVPTVAGIAAFLLLIAGVIGLVMVGVSESLLGRHGVFLIQCILGLLMAFAGMRWLPPAKRAVAPTTARVPAVSTERHAVVARRRRRRVQSHGGAAGVARWGRVAMA